MADEDDAWDFDALSAIEQQYQASKQVQHAPGRPYAAQGGLETAGSGRYASSSTAAQRAPAQPLQQEQHGRAAGYSLHSGSVQPPVPAWPSSGAGAATFPGQVYFNKQPAGSSTLGPPAASSKHTSYTQGQIVRHDTFAQQQQGQQGLQGAGGAYGSSSGSSHQAGPHAAGNPSWPGVSQTVQTQGGRPSGTQLQPWQHGQQHTWQQQQQQQQPYQPVEGHRAQPLGTHDGPAGALGVQYAQQHPHQQQQQQQQQGPWGHPHEHQPMHPAPQQQQQVHNLHAAPHQQPLHQVHAQHQQQQPLGAGLQAPPLMGRPALPRGNGTGPGTSTCQVPAAPSRQGRGASGTSSTSGVRPLPSQDDKRVPYQHNSALVHKRQVQQAQEQLQRHKQQSTMASYFTATGAPTTACDSGSGVDQLVRAGGAPAVLPGGAPAVGSCLSGSGVAAGNTGQVYVPQPVQHPQQQQPGVQAHQQQLQGEHGVIVIDDDEAPTTAAAAVAGSTLQGPPWPLGVMGTTSAAAAAGQGGPAAAGAPPVTGLGGGGPQLPAQHLQLVRLEGAAQGGGGAPGQDRRQHPKVLQLDPLKDAATVSAILHPDAASQALRDLPGVGPDFPLRLHTQAAKHWVYPCDLEVREYQFNVTATALFHNTLVCLPTGLGKTLVAAVVMYNFYRWFPRGKVVFVAPTNPLVTQQLEACRSMMGVKQEDIAQLTRRGKTAAARDTQWQHHRVFFCTPQILSNDLKTGVCPAEEVVCLVLDECHKAVGDSDYVKAARALFERRVKFRLLALSATPGSTFNKIQEVIRNLRICRVEFRDEADADVARYCHERTVDTLLVDPSAEVTQLRGALQQLLLTKLQALQQAKLIPPQALQQPSTLNLAEARTLAIRQGGKRGKGGAAGAGSSFGVAWLQPNQGDAGGGAAAAGGGGGGLTNVQLVDQALHLQAVLRALEEGYGAVQGVIEAAEKKEGHVVRALSKHTQYQTVRARLEGWASASDPKTPVLIEVLTQHFGGVVEDPLLAATTRAIVFCSYREVVYQLEGALAAYAPLIHAQKFIGQGEGRRGEKGMAQSEQAEVLRAFREGGCNVLLATCIGEEGLDIPQVDLIVCWDASASPSRARQRMGRTGRHRPGRVVVLLGRGGEEARYAENLRNEVAIKRALRANDRLLDLCQQDVPMLPTSDPLPQGVLLSLAGAGLAPGTAAAAAARRRPAKRSSDPPANGEDAESGPSSKRARQQQQQHGPRSTAAAAQRRGKGAAQLPPVVVDPDDGMYSQPQEEEEEGGALPADLAGGVVTGWRPGVTGVDGVAPHGAALTGEAGSWDMPPVDDPTAAAQGATPAAAAGGGGDGLGSADSLDIALDAVLGGRACEPRRGRPPYPAAPTAAARARCDAATTSPLAAVEGAAGTGQQMPSVSADIAQQDEDLLDMELWAADPWAGPGTSSRQLTSVEGPAQGLPHENCHRPQQQQQFSDDAGTSHMPGVDRSPPRLNHGSTTAVLARKGPAAVMAPTGAAAVYSSPAIQVSPSGALQVDLQQLGRLLPGLPAALPGANLRGLLQPPRLQQLQEAVAACGHPLAPIALVAAQLQVEGCLEGGQQQQQGPIDSQHPGILQQQQQQQQPIVTGRGADQQQQQGGHQAGQHIQQAPRQPLRDCSNQLSCQDVTRSPAASPERCNKPDRPSAAPAPAAAAAHAPGVQQRLAALLAGKPAAPTSSHGRAVQPFGADGEVAGQVDAMLEEGVLLQGGPPESEPLVASLEDVPLAARFRAHAQQRQARQQQQRQRQGVPQAGGQHQGQGGLLGQQVGLGRGASPAASPSPAAAAAAAPGVVHGSIINLCSQEEDRLLDVPLRQRAQLRPHSGDAQLGPGGGESGSQEPLAVRLHNRRASVHADHQQQQQQQGGVVGCTPSAQCQGRDLALQAAAAAKGAEEEPGSLSQVPLLVRARAASVPPAAVGELELSQQPLSVRRRAASRAPAEVAGPSLSQVPLAARRGASPVPVHAENPVCLSQQPLAARLQAGSLVASAAGEGTLSQQPLQSRLERPVQVVGQGSGSPAAALGADDSPWGGGDQHHQQQQCQMQQQQHMEGRSGFGAPPAQLARHESGCVPASAAAAAAGQADTAARSHLLIDQPHQEVVAQQQPGAPSCAVRGGPSPAHVLPPGMGLLGVMHVPPEQQRRMRKSGESGRQGSGHSAGSGGSRGQVLEARGRADAPGIEQQQEGALALSRATSLPAAPAAAGDAAVIAPAVPSAQGEPHGLVRDLPTAGVGAAAQGGAAGVPQLQFWRTVLQQTPPQASLGEPEQLQQQQLTQLEQQRQQQQQAAADGPRGGDVLLQGVQQQQQQQHSPDTPPAPAAPAATTPLANGMQQMAWVVPETPLDDDMMYVQEHLQQQQQQRACSWQHQQQQQVQQWVPPGASPTVPHSPGGALQHHSSSSFAAPSSSSPPQASDCMAPAAARNHSQQHEVAPRMRASGGAGMLQGVQPSRPVGALGTPSSLSDHHQQQRQQQQQQEEEQAQQQQQQQQQQREAQQQQKDEGPQEAESYAEEQQGLDILASPGTLWEEEHMQLTFQPVPVVPPKPAAAAWAGPAVRHSFVAGPAAAAAGGSTWRGGPGAHALPQRSRASAGGVGVRGLQARRGVAPPVAEPSWDDVEDSPQQPAVRQQQQQQQRPAGPPAAGRVFSRHAAAVPPASTAGATAARSALDAARPAMAAPQGAAVAMPAAAPPHVPPPLPTTSLPGAGQAVTDDCVAPSSPAANGQEVAAAAECHQQGQWDQGVGPFSPGGWEDPDVCLSPGPRQLFTSPLAPQRQQQQQVGRCCLPAGGPQSGVDGWLHLVGPVQPPALNCSAAAAAVAGSKAVLAGMAVGPSPATGRGLMLSQDAGDMVRTLKRAKPRKRKAQVAASSSSNGSGSGDDAGREDADVQHAPLGIAGCQQGGPAAAAAGGAGFPGDCVAVTPSHRQVLQGRQLLPQGSAAGAPRPQPQAHHHDQQQQQQGPVALPHTGGTGDSGSIRVWRRHKRRRPVLARRAAAAAALEDSSEEEDVGGQAALTGPAAGGHCGAGVMGPPRKPGGPAAAAMAAGDAGRATGRWVHGGRRRSWEVAHPSSSKGGHSNHPSTGGRANGGGSSGDELLEDELEAEAAAAGGAGGGGGGGRRGGAEGGRRAAPQRQRCHLFELEAAVSSSQEGSSEEMDGEGPDTDLSGFIAVSGATTPATGCTDRSDGGMAMYHRSLLTQTPQGGCYDIRAMVGGARHRRHRPPGDDLPEALQARGGRGAAGGLMPPPAPVMQGGRRAAAGGEAGVRGGGRYVAEEVDMEEEDEEEEEEEEEEQVWRDRRHGKRLMAGGGHQHNTARGPRPRLPHAAADSSDQIDLISSDSGSEGGEGRSVQQQGAGAARRSQQHSRPAVARRGRQQRVLDESSEEEGGQAQGSSSSGNSEGSSSHGTAEEGSSEADSGSHEDECMVCGQGGDLLLCDGCPRVVHLACVGLQRLPPGDWFCAFCAS